MKKLLPFFFLFLAVFSACSDKEVGPLSEEKVTPKPEEDENNRPKQLQLTKITSTYVSPGEKNFISTLTYKSGLLSVYAEDHADGVNGYRSTHQYGADGRLATFTLYNKANEADGKFIEKQVFSYNPTGKLETVTVTPGDGSPTRHCTFTYDAQGRVEVIKESAKESTGNAFRFVYDGLGNVVEISSYKTSETGELEKDPVYFSRIKYDDKKNPYKGMGSLLYGYNHPLRYLFYDTRISPARFFSPNNPTDVETMTSRSFFKGVNTFSYNEEGFPSEVKSHFMVQKLEYSMQ